jgi:hypothetical protein
MKYWFYSEGNILGPYAAAEMLALPAFAEESLVCPETATGDNPGDWRPASQVAEIAAALSVGTGRMVAAGPLSASYEYETGFSSSVSYFENRESSPSSSSSSYGDLLDAIDGVLGAYKETPAASGKPAETDYDLAEKFDIRLSRIQEELEAARWEKNLLLEKIRMKDMEEQKNRARIGELEARLKSEGLRKEDSDKEFEQVRHLADLKEKAETLRQIEEIKKEELSMREPEAPAPAPAAEAAPQPAAAQAVEPPQPKAEPAFKPERAFKPEPVSGPSALEPRAAEPEMPGPAIEVKSFKSIKAGSRLKLESTLGKELKEEAEDDPSLTSRKLRSLGQTQAPAYVYGSHYDKPLPGPEAAPPGAFKPESLEPLPQQAGGVVYDFTVVTSRPADVQQFKIEPRQEPPADYRPVKPPTYDFGVQQPPAQQPPAQQAAPAPQPFQFQPVQPVMAPAPAPAPAPQAAPQPQPAFQFQTAAQAAAPQPAPAPAAVPAAQMSPASTSAPSGKPGPEAPEDMDKTQRISLPTPKGKPAVKADDKPRKKGGRTAFLVILVLFGSMAAGGLGYFFLGEGVSFSEFSMLSLGQKKKPVPLSSQLDKAPEGEEAAPAQAAATAAQPVPAQQAAPAPQPANENIKKALDIVKNYKLSGGRGNIATWFANSFLSNTGGANEEWTATPLHGDILVVQYRLLRPRQDPLIYQFEVDAAKQDIVRGINNNAIDLLDFSPKGKTASAAPAKKAAPQKVRKPARPGEVPILPLPDAPAAGPSEQEPTGFENPQADSEQVKYLKAQESDEDLF